MGITGKNNKTSTSSSSGEKWGMGLLLVFFSEDDDAILNKKKKNNNSFSASPSSSSISPITNNIIRRTNSNLILTRTQSTISICALLVFITFLLFTLSTFEPTIPHTPLPRRFLSGKISSYPQNPIPKPTIHPQNPPIFSSWVGKIWENKLHHRPKIGGASSSTTPTSSSYSSLHALQGMGTLFMRGTRAMNDLIVVHAVGVEEDDGANGNRMRMFMRMLHRSGLTSRADTIFIFPSSTTMNSSVIHGVIREENDSLLELVRRYRKLNNDSVPSFDLTRYVKSGKKGKETRELPIWGKKIRGDYSNNSDGEIELTRYGSVVGFDLDELDPENSLAGFFDNNVPLSLRRWACYPMLLGRVRRNYKHVMLVDMKNILLLGDPLGRVRNRSPESVFLFGSTFTKHARKNSDKTRQVNSAVVLGGARGVRRLSKAMLTEIVRGAMQQHKGKHPLTESGILNQLVRNEFILKDSVSLITSTESIPDTSSLTGLNRNTGSRFTLVQRGNSNTSNNDNHDINLVIMKHICSFEVDSSVYRDCEQHKNIKEIKL